MKKFFRAVLMSIMIGFFGMVFPLDSKADEIFPRDHMAYDKVNNLWDSLPVSAKERILDKNKVTDCRTGETLSFREALASNDKCTVDLARDILAMYVLFFTRMREDYLIPDQTLYLRGASLFRTVIVKTFTDCSFEPTDDDLERTSFFVSYVAAISPTAPVFEEIFDDLFHFYVYSIVIDEDPSIARLHAVCIVRKFVQNMKSFSE